VSSQTDLRALELAQKFHEAYERLAPSFGYETRKETRLFDPDLANGRLMVAVCREILAGESLLTRAEADEAGMVMVQRIDAKRLAEAVCDDDAASEVLSARRVLAQLAGTEADEAATVGAVALAKTALERESDKSMGVGFDQWYANPYTAVLLKSIAEDYVPRTHPQDASAGIREFGHVDGVVVYKRSEGAGKNCVCCDGDHVYSCAIVYDEKAERPDDTALDELIRRFTHQVENEGKRVRVTIAALPSPPKGEG
jgi:hypothetical protein